VATLEYVVNDRPLATLLLSAGHTPDVDASERVDMFFTEVRDLLRRALETGMDLGLVRRCPSELVAAALLGMIRGVIELMVRQADAARPVRAAGPATGATNGAVNDAAPETVHATVNDAVSEMLQVALRGVLA
jgi:hypothetical protein